MAILKNTTITGSNLSIPIVTTATRPTTGTVITSYTTVTAGTPWVCPTGVTAIEVLVVAGGGGGSGSFCGGGGAGGLVYSPSYPVTPGSSYTVVVGAGGLGGLGWNQTDGTMCGANGSDSAFGVLVAKGGGGGGMFGTVTGSGLSYPGGQKGQNGGSGGGGASFHQGLTDVTYPFSVPGFSNQPTYANAQSYGNRGGYGDQSYPGGGGGGAGEPGYNARYDSRPGAGGNGLNFDISGTPTWYAGGGGGSGQSDGEGQGGLGGGGKGSNGTPAVGFCDATANTGGGGGAAGYSGATNLRIGGTGGSGIVIVRYNLPTNSTDPTGVIEYNTDIGGIEINQPRGWQALDSRRNFAGTNLHNYSEQLDNTFWTSLGSGMTVTPNAATAPDGTLTADAVVPSNANTSHYLYSNTAYTKTANAPQTTSLYAKRVNYDFITIQGSDNTAGSGIQQGFNLATGQLGTTTVQGSGVFVSASMTDVGNGWYRCVLVARSPGAVARTAIGVNGNGTLSNAGNGSSYNLIWGVQVEDNVITPRPYTRTVDTLAPAPGRVGNWLVHTYTTVGTSSFAPALTGTVEVLVVAGGGSGASSEGGGGGAGGVIYNTQYAVTAGRRYTVTVGAGGAQTTGTSNNGSNSVFGTLTAVGGGGGGTVNNNNAKSGGSGGGGGRTSSVVCYGGAGTAGQGNQGGIGPVAAGYPAGGGGGAGMPGEVGQAFGLNGGSGGQSGRGGDGILVEISGTPTWYGGGGGGSGGNNNGNPAAGAGGRGGGGYGGAAGGAPATPVAGLANTGGGGGAGGQGATFGAAGGSGIVIVRYKYF